MSNTVTNVIRGGSFNAQMSNEELARRCDDLERTVKMQIELLNELLSTKVDASEIVPTAFKDGRT